MTFGLKPYSMKSLSSAEWLGEIPAHWGVKPNRALFEEIKIQGCPDEPLLSVTISKGVIRQSDMLSGTSKKDSSNLDKTKYKLVQLGEIVYNKMRAWQGAVGMSEHRGITSPAYIVQRPRPEVYSKYAHYLLRTPGFSKEAERWSYGIASDQWSLRPEDFKKIYACLPPFKEQIAIACYLDHIGHRINQYIQAKQKLIALLDEQKQAIIQEAVTGRTDVRTGQLYAAYKDSGVEWLGEVPDHWKVKKLGQIGNFSKGRGGSKEDEVLQGIPCIRYGNLYTTHQYFIHSSKSFIPRDIVKEYTQIEFGDVLFAASGETIDEIGKSAVNLLQSEAYCGGDVIIFRSALDIDPRYLGYATDCREAAIQKAVAGRGVTVIHIYVAQLKHLKIVIPPFSEQTAIVRYLDKKTSKIDKAITRAQREVELLREYHQRLISDVVTGKLDVREAAAKLPPEADDCVSTDPSDKIPDHKMPHDGIEPDTSGAML